MNLFEILDLAPHGPDTFVGAGPHYPWGGLYGGQIVAQALQASTSTVDPGFVVHSLRAYFIRRGDHSETVRYEVDRIRNGRSFCTRRVVARQSVGAILNLEASYHAPEEAADIETVSIPPGVPRPDELEQESWSPAFERAFVPADRMDLASRSGAGRAVAWLRVTGEIAPDDTAMHQGGLAYLSDDLPTDAVVRAHPMGREPREVLERVMFSASLDHAIWFHRPLRVDAWHLYDFSLQTLTGGRGLSIGQVFAADGTHAATVAQEVLLRDTRERPEDQR
jgi:acyl-CoA thioesterase II